MNKSLLTNVCALCLIVIGYLVPFSQNIVRSVGYFALSGAITNWLAVYMLFEKVPFLYGSGVVPNRFEAFKAAIKSLMMTQFFTQDNLDRFFKQEEKSLVKSFDFSPMIATLDYDKLFSDFVNVVLNSSFGGMLGMFGGKKVLDGLKAPFTEKIKVTLSDITKSESFLSTLDAGIMASYQKDNIMAKLEGIIDQRLDELTPQLVKTMVQDMMQRHLGWLVVWGGVFGGIIGAVMGGFM